MSCRRSCLAFVLAAGTSAAIAAPPAPDTMQQRVQACTACHGEQGRAAADGYYPRIAGKPAGYLFNQLTGFRDGRRHYALMVNLIEPLSGPVGEAYLREIAAHFAAIELPYPAPQPPTASPGGARAWPHAGVARRCRPRRAGVRGVSWQRVDRRAAGHTGAARFAARLCECAARRLAHRQPARARAGLHGRGGESTGARRHQRGFAMACGATGAAVGQGSGYLAITGAQALRRWCAMKRVRADRCRCHRSVVGARRRRVEPPR